MTRVHGFLHPQAEAEPESDRKPGGVSDAESWAMIDSLGSTDTRDLITVAGL